MAASEKCGLRPRFERCVVFVLLPVGGAVAGLGLQGVTHRPKLPEAVTGDLCNNTV